MNKILLLSGMSGCGKSTLMKNLLKRYPLKYHLVMSTTTRPIREGEVNEIDYRFVSQFAWDNVLSKDPNLIQKTHFGGNWYGTFKEDYQRDDREVAILAVVPEHIEVIKKKFPDKDVRHVFFNVSDHLLRRHLSNLPDDVVEERIRRGTIREDYYRIYRENRPHDACWLDDGDINENLHEYINQFVDARL